MTYWTLEYDSEEKTLEDWGIEEPQLQFTNRNGSTLSFGVVGDFDAADVFAEGEAVILRSGRALAAGVFSGGVQRFVGEIQQTPRSLGGDFESHSYVAVGPMVWLSELMYGQMWYQSGGAKKTTHVLLNRNLRTDQQIAAVLQAAITAGMPAQIGTIDPLVAIPISEARDMSCQEVIEHQLRLSPDVVMWEDHSTSPPTIHCRRYTNLATVNVAVGGEALSGAEIHPRHDLVLPGVLLNFETTSEVDGEAMINVNRQWYPAPTTGDERRCLISTFDLTGPKITHAKTHLETAAILAKDADANNRLNWWKVRSAWFNQTGISDVAIDPASVKFYTAKWGNGPANWTAGDYAKRIDGVGAGMVTTYYQSANDLVGYTGDPASDSDNWTAVGTQTVLDTYYTMAEVVWATYPRQRQLMDGTFQPWLEGLGYSAEKLIAAAVVSYTTSINGQPSAGSAPISLELVATDAETGDYSSITEVEAGETEPAGLAQFIYETHAILHYQGSIALTEEECGFSVLMGRRLNLTGGTGRYATMAALVQSVSLNISTGATRVSFGPPRGLGPGDIVEWARAWRNRRVWTNPATQDDGKVGSQSEIASGRFSPTQNSSAGGLSHTRLVVAVGSIIVDIDPTNNRLRITGTDGSMIDLDVSKCAGKTLEPRTVDICVNGVAKKMIGVFSEIFDP